MSQEELFINGELLRLRREARGWVLNDMATRACMSVKQIRQLEEGGISSFYSVAVKVTAAKKVGALLGLSADEVFAQNTDSVVSEQLIESDALISEVVADPATASQPVYASPVSAQSEPKSEQVQSVVDSSDLSVSKDDAPNSKNNLWLILALLGGVLAVGAYFRPQEVPVAEPAPPIQVLPVDAVDAASAASAADASASTSGVASASMSPAIPAAAVPAATPASAIRAASSPVVATPSLSAGSKAP